MLNTRKLIQVAGGLFGIAIFTAAIAYLHNELATVSWAQVATNVRSHSLARMLASAGLAAGGYAALTGYDALALRYIRHPLPYPRTALAAFMAFAFGHNLGLAPVSGGSIRYRMYSPMGLTGNEIVQVIAFCSLTFAVGASFLLGSALLTLPSADLGAVILPARAVRILGGALLVLALCYVGAPLAMSTPIRIGNWQLELPTVSITLRQLVISSLELSLAAGTLYVLLAPYLPVGFLPFLGIYLLAVGAGLLSSLPGGIGVFEAALLLALPSVDREILLSTIVVYRLIYYIAPLAIAIALLGGHEIAARRAPITRTGRATVDALSRVAPYAFSILVFLAGVVLLVSGSTPAAETRLALVGRLIPHGLLQSSHLAGSLFGICLLILSRGLYRRLRGAYRLTIAALLAGMIASLLKGFDYEESVLLMLVALALWSARREFYRQGSLGNQSFSVPWVSAIVIAVIGSIWVGFLSFRHIPYSNELIWQFSVDGEAPRMLRAAIVVVATALAFSVWKLMRASRVAAQPMSPRDAEDVARIVESASDPTANAALIGDKRFLFSDDRSAFIMYQVQGRSWIALGEPVGDERQKEALAWRFRELCDRHDGWPAFYHVTDRNLALYLDLGLTLWKLGEEGRVAVPDFSLAGRARADLRQARNRASRAQATFSIIARAEVAARLGELRAVSDSWLRSKSAAEKSFSLGAFSEAYLRHFDCAVVSIGDRIVAFANLWPAPVAHELSIDLMRYEEGAPNGTMDFLLSELILWAGRHGYQWFDMGMAPLSGLESRPLSPLWQKLGNAVFRHADEYYSFDGLRAYKEKFDPEWRPRYLACRNALVFPRVLYDTTVLIAGGLRAMVSR